MFFSQRLYVVMQSLKNYSFKSYSKKFVRTATSTSTGEILPMPKKVKFGLLGVACAVMPGLLIGATISKKMANFLEENELFVPSDDDDDDD
ncbi:essential MCU regulator, mitochondrial-like [Rhodnius prolixus]|uniref:Essential MCU regulator, mitochondrial n=1 Tax=Rhodnius prolixus TaxID=13249 RepID=A0A905R0N0_RHOPR